MEFAGVRSATPDGLTAIVAATLGIRDDAPSAPPATGTGATSPVHRLTAALRDRRTLLVLDSCEHVVAAAAELVALLPAQRPPAAHPHHQPGTARPGRRGWCSWSNHLPPPRTPCACSPSGPPPACPASGWAPATQRPGQGCRPRHRRRDLPPPGRHPARPGTGRDPGTRPGRPGVGRPPR
ncbi:hypothetical protein LT493_40555 [Streptomyces tricolor]|nr:hypothetical protein [Streptomyces tricolor]